MLSISTTSTVWRHAARVAKAWLCLVAGASGRESLDDVVQRMRYWHSTGSSELDVSSPEGEPKYLLMEQDGAGLNNKRIGWEMAGLIAQHVGRTLVLPPNEAWWAIDKDGSSSKTEDFINLNQLRGGLPVLTFQEFAQREKLNLQLPDWTVANELSYAQRSEWKTFALKHFASPGKRQALWCDLQNYRSDKTVIYANHNMEGRLLDCERWWSLGEPELTEGLVNWAVPTNSYALLQNHFVWHEDVFKLAAPIVRELGLFNYAALHARFNDFRTFAPQAVQSAEGVLEKWGGDMSLLQTSERVVRKHLGLDGMDVTLRSRIRAESLLSRVEHWVKPGTVLYVSTDEADESFLRTFRDHGIDVHSASDFFDKADSPIRDLIQQDPARAEKLRGCVEQVICTFSRIFLGTAKSTFSGYITRMRIYADAPQTGRNWSTRLFHTRAPSRETIQAVEAEIAAWEARSGKTRIGTQLGGNFSSAEGQQPF